MCLPLVTHDDRCPEEENIHQFLIVESDLYSVMLSLIKMLMHRAAAEPSQTTSAYHVTSWQNRADDANEQVRTPGGWSALLAFIPLSLVDAPSQECFPAS